MLSPLLRDHSQRLADAGQYARQQYIDFEDRQGINVILVLFYAGAVLHGGIVDRAERIEAGVMCGCPS